MNYVEQGTNVLRTGLGPQRNKVPLGRNATFSFSYTSGKVFGIQKITLILKVALKLSFQVQLKSLL